MNLRFARATATTPGNRVQLLQSGQAFFPALIAAIDAAVHEVHLETYIFHADSSGEAVRAALQRAASRGVAVRVLVDGIGSRPLPVDWFDALKAAGAQVLVYRPLFFGWRLSPGSLRRLHRKLAVIDARHAFVGGINLIDDFEPIAHPAPRLDFSVAVEGPVLAEIYPNVRRLWRLIALSQLRVHRRHALVPSWPTDAHARAAFVVRDNFAHRRDIERGYLAAIALAQSEIVIACAYFLPGRRFRRLLKNAAARGVRVRLLVQGRTDHPVYQMAARALYRDLLMAGVELYEYQASELHAKVAVIDGQWATVGSSNIDPFSLLLAREANLVVDDVAFSNTLRQRLHTAIEQGAQQVEPTHWQRRAWPRRMLSWLAYGGVRGLVGLAGFRRWV
ncbi:MAG: cardiolipin synthase ClsB [Thiobacillus sp.]